MKKLLSFVAVVFLCSFSYVDDPLTQKEKDDAVKYLNETQQSVIESIKGLTEAQLKFKPAADKWSVEECVKHIAASESNLWGMVEGALKLPANPQKRSEIKATDEQVMNGASDRSTKRKTFDALEPASTSFTSAADALENFKTNRGKLIDYVKNSNDDMRNHVAELPMGNFDAYQLILLIASHSNRHKLQIEEVKADPNFPKAN